jgi:S1-C subfamily serine protease
MCGSVNPKGGLLLLGMLLSILACETRGTEVAPPKTVQAAGSVAEGEEVAVPPGEHLWTELPPGPRSLDFAIRADTFRNLARRTNPAVVSLYSTQAGLGRTISDPLGIVQFGIPLPRIGTSLGSGFIIRQDGYILTADHVVSGSRKIKIVLMENERGESVEYGAKLLGRSKEAGVALLKIEPRKPLPVLPLGDSSTLEIGDQVVAVGNPYGLSHTVTSGIVSFIGRKLSERDRRTGQLEFIQIDAPINPGNSGGPLLNLFGEAVGINTAIAAQAQGIGFAVPVNTAKRALPGLLSRR